MPKSLLLLAALFVASPAFAQAPGPPQNLTASVSGTTVTLNWTAPATGGPPTGYVVEASVVPGGPIVATLPVAGTSLTVPNVPGGTYFVRVRATNGAGSSGPSNEVTVTVGSTGCPAPPLPPQLRVQSTGLNAGANWASAGGCAPTSYTLFAGSGPGLSDILQLNMGGGTSVGGVVPAGVYYVRVVGTNAFGSATSEERIARIFVNTVNDTVLAFERAFFELTITSTGTYRGVMMWNDATIDLDLYLTTPGCPYPPTGCTLQTSAATGTNTEQVAHPVAVGQNYRLWVDNLSGRGSSFTITNTVTP